MTLEDFAVFADLPEAWHEAGQSLTLASAAVQACTAYHCISTKGALQEGEIHGQLQSLQMLRVIIGNSAEL